VAQILNMLLPFVGIASLLASIIIFISALFPKSRAKKLKISGGLFLACALCVALSGFIEKSAAEEEMRDAGVNTKEELNLLKIEKLSEEVRDSFNTSRNKIETIEEVNFQLSLIDGWAKRLDEVKDFTLDSDGVSASSEVYDEIKKYQSAIFPKLRDLYGPIAKRELWIDNGTARTIGSSYKEIEIISPMFIVNRAINDFHIEIEDSLLRMRFTRATYKWVKSGGAYSYVKLKTPSDEAVGYWLGKRFVDVSID